MAKTWKAAIISSGKLRRHIVQLHVNVSAGWCARVRLLRQVARRRLVPSNIRTALEDWNFASDVGTKQGCDDFDVGPSADAEQTETKSQLAHSLIKQHGK